MDNQHWHKLPATWGPWRIILKSQIMVTESKVVDDLGEAMSVFSLAVTRAVIYLSVHRGVSALLASQLIQLLIVMCDFGGQIHFSLENENVSICLCSVCVHVFYLIFCVIFSSFIFSLVSHLFIMMRWELASWAPSCELVARCLAQAHHLLWHS